MNFVDAPRLARRLAGKTIGRECELGRAAEELQAKGLLVLEPLNANTWLAKAPPTPSVEDGPEALLAPETRTRLEARRLAAREARS